MIRNVLFLPEGSLHECLTENFPVHKFNAQLVEEITKHHVIGDRPLCQAHTFPVLKFETVNRRTCGEVVMFQKKHRFA